MLTSRLDAMDAQRYDPFKRGVSTDFFFLFITQLTYSTDLLVSILCQYYDKSEYWTQ
jgi:hypothetical protein